MITFKQFLMEVKSKKPPQLAVIFGGRFQPFHRGHYDTYCWLVDIFGDDCVWIATSNKVSCVHGEKLSPWSFVERVNLAVAGHDIDPSKFVQCVNPTFSPKEILERYDDSVVYVTVVGEKDVERYQTANFKPFLSADDVIPGTSYYLTAPITHDISGTSVRQSFLKASTDKQLKAAWSTTFTKTYDDRVARLIQTRLMEVM